ncbi:MAG: PEP/pyruvate-binding domain-containing protein [Candidatus Omnitrophota bacterium]
MMKRNYIAKVTSWVILQAFLLTSTLPAYALSEVRGISSHLRTPAVMGTKDGGNQILDDLRNPTQNLVGKISAILSQARQGGATLPELVSALEDSKASDPDLSGLFIDESTRLEKGDALAFYVNGERVILGVDSLGQVFPVSRGDYAKALADQTAKELEITHKVPMRLYRQSVALETLVPTQDEATQEGVDFWKGEVPKGDLEEIIVVKPENRARFYLMRGLHRAVALEQSGKTYVDAWVIDFGINHRESASAFAPAERANRGIKPLTLSDVAILPAVAIDARKTAQDGGAKDQLSPIKLTYSPWDLGATEVPFTGGKGANLIKMWRNGDPGKIHWVISPLGYRRHIEGNRVEGGRTVKAAIRELTMNLDTSVGENRRKAERTIGRWLMNAPLAQDIQDTIDQAYFDLTRFDVMVRMKDLIAFLADQAPERKAGIERLYQFADKANQEVAVGNWGKWAATTREKLEGIRKNFKVWIKDEAELRRANEFLDDILADLDEGVRIFVRSTGVLEDMPFAAFPGQYETYENIKGRKQVREAVLRDWASNYTERVIDYRDQEILKMLARDPETKRIWEDFKARLESDAETAHLVRFFESFREDDKSTKESNYSSLRLWNWFRRQKDWDAGKVLLDKLEEYRNLFIDPDNVEMAVVLHKAAYGTDRDIPRHKKTAAANAFDVDIPTGFTGWVFGTDALGRPVRRARIKVIDSNDGWGVPLVQNDVTGDNHAYLCFDDEFGKRRYVRLGVPLLGDKKIWAASMEDAQAQLEEERKAGNGDLAASIDQAITEAQKKGRKLVYLPTPPKDQDEFALTESELLDQVRMSDRSSDIYILRDFLEHLTPEQRGKLAEKLKQAGFGEETVLLFRSFQEDVWASISPDQNPLQGLWHWLYTKADKETQEEYLPHLKLDVKDTETSLISVLGRRKPVMIQSRDFAKTTDQDDPWTHRDERTVIDVKALEREGFDVKVHPNGFIEARHPDGRQLVPIIGDPNSGGIATSMADIGYARVLLRGEDAPLPEDQIQLGPEGQKWEFLIGKETAPQDLRGMAKSKGVVTEEGTKTSHAAIESQGLRIATVVGVRNFIEKVRAEDPERAEWLELLLGTDGIYLCVDGNNGFVYLAGDPGDVLREKADRLRGQGEKGRADRIEFLLAKYGRVKPIVPPIEQLKVKQRIKRLPRLRRKVGFIMSNLMEGWRATKLGLSELVDGVVLFRAEFGFGYVGVHPRAVIAHEALTLLEGEVEGNLTQAEQERLDFLRNEWGVRGKKFWSRIQKDVEILRKHPEVIKKIDRRIRGFKPDGWKRHSAVKFFKETHGGVVGSTRASFPWWHKFVYRFVDFKLREMKAQIGGNIFLEGFEEGALADSMVGFRGQTYLLHPDNLPTYLLELEVLAELMKNGLPVEPMFAFVRYPGQLEESMEIAMEVFRYHGVVPRAIYMMSEIWSNVFEAEVYADILKRYADQYGFEWGFSFGTNDLTQGTLQMGRDIQGFYAIRLGKNVSEYTKKSPFVWQDSEGNYILLSFSEARPEIIRSIYHVSRITKKRGGKLKLCGEALNKLSVDNPEAAAKIGANLDTGGAGVLKFQDVVGRTFAPLELRLGFVAPEVRAANEEAKIAEGLSTLSQGAADRTLVKVESPEDVLEADIGDFLLLDTKAIESVSALLGSEDEKDKEKKQEITAKIGLAGGLLLAGVEGEQDTRRVFAQKLKKPAILVGPESYGVLSEQHLEIVTADFGKGVVYKGRLPLEEREQDEPDIIEELLALSVRNRDLSFLPVSRFNSSQTILDLGVHPRVIYDVLGNLVREQFITSGVSVPILGILRRAGLATEEDIKTPVSVNRLLQRLYREHRKVRNIVGRVYEQLFYEEFLEFAKKANEQNQTAVFQMDNLKAGEYLRFPDAKKYESEETNPALGMKGALRYIKPEYQPLLRAMFRAVKRVQAEGHDVAFLVTEANVPEYTAEVRRIYEEEIRGKDLPFGLMVMTPGHLVNIQEHLDVGQYDFVYMDTEEFPYDIMLADAGNEAIRNLTPNEVVENFNFKATRMVRAAVYKANQQQGAKAVQIAIGDEALHSVADGGAKDFMLSEKALEVEIPSADGTAEGDMLASTQDGAMKLGPVLRGAVGRLDALLGPQSDKAGLEAGLRAALEEMLGERDALGQEIDLPAIVAQARGNPARGEFSYMRQILFRHPELGYEIILNVFVRDKSYLGGDYTPIHGHGDGAYAYCILEGEGREYQFKETEASYQFDDEGRGGGDAELVLEEEKTLRQGDIAVFPGGDSRKHVIGNFGGSPYLVELAVYQEAPSATGIMTYAPKDGSLADLVAQQMLRPNVPIEAAVRLVRPTAKGESSTARDGDAKISFGEAVTLIADQISDETLDLYTGSKPLIQAVYDGIDAGTTDETVRLLSRVLARGALYEASRGKKSSTSAMPFMRDPYTQSSIDAAGRLAGKKALVLDVSRLLDPRLERPDLESFLNKMRGVLFFTTPSDEVEENLRDKYGVYYNNISRMFAENNTTAVSQAEFVVRLSAFPQIQVLRLTERTFEVPLVSEADAAKEIRLGTALLEQSSLLDDSAKLDIGMQILLAEVAGHEDAEALISSVQEKMEEAQRFVTEVLKGL